MQARWCSLCLTALLLTGLAGSPRPARAAEAKAKVLPIENDQIHLPGPIVFANRSAEVSRESQPLLDSVAATLETRLELSLVEIGVHTDSRGSAGYNKRICQDRADAIRRLLIAKGVPAERLKALGYGEERPIASNRTEAGRAENRRVEFLVRERCPAGQGFFDGRCQPRASAR
jgi:outer membrane protein OmpA-like peptidoglycan-associated protein